MKAGVLNALRKIGGGRFFPLRVDSLAGKRRAGWLEPRDTVLGAAAALLAASVAATFGAGWSAILPAAFAGFSASMLGLIAWREAVPQRARPTAAVTVAPIASPLLDHLPGLVVGHDATALVL